MFDIVALGECLIDFTPSGFNELGMQLFSCNPGGAPANVLAMNAKLGGRTSFIGKVGDDGFGSFLEKTMVKAGIDVSGLLKTGDVPTTLAFVQLDEQGERTFSFYRKPGADICLKPEEVQPQLLSNCRIFHFGSVSLTDEPSRTATLHAARQAKAAGAIVSFDPNYRPALWGSEAQAVRAIREALPLADIVKVSDEEMLLLTGTDDPRKGADLLAASGACLVLITGGEKGSCYRTTQCFGLLHAFDVPATDTTGCGDAFLGALLYRLAGRSKAEIGALPKDTLTEIVTYANAAGGLTATAKGAIPAMPDGEQILRCVREMPLRQ